MKYVALDIETTGLDLNMCQVLRVSAIVDDTARPEVPIEDLPVFDRLVHSVWVRGEPEALAWHNYLLETIAAGKDVRLVTWGAIPGLLRQFLDKRDVDVSERGLVWVGKNLSTLDFPFLWKNPHYDEYFPRPKYIVDVGAIFFRPGMERMPSSFEVAQTIDFDFSATHDSVEDARLVVAAFRHHLKNLPAES